MGRLPSRAQRAAAQNRCHSTMSIITSAKPCGRWGGISTSGEEWTTRSGCGSGRRESLGAMSFHPGPPHPPDDQEREPLIEMKLTPIQQHLWSKVDEGNSTHTLQNVHTTNHQSPITNHPLLNMWGRSVQALSGSESRARGGRGVLEAPAQEA